MELCKPFFDLGISEKCVNPTDFPKITKKLVDCKCGYENKNIIAKFNCFSFV